MLDAAAAEKICPGGLVSGFVSLGGKVGDDYEAIDASLGVSLRW